MASAQFATNYYYNAYPQAAVKDIKAALRVQDAVRDFGRLSETMSPEEFGVAWVRFLIRIQSDIGSTPIMAGEVSTF